ncbi:hypothetical protein [Pseudosulfitobacter koreensis]|uniref:PH domain-containing protein n=1 Tax=Pseudosulfitobacter koreensis TaxID=2968472 RepID=A0ABT1YXS0_9RHOB|nr:hypothetical protein [Pseudosulfitobacter koreense]MCR8825676.1 hypothetical protein [Pseudosulfitobacter koreense]
MTATPDYLCNHSETSRAILNAPIRSLDGACMVARMLLRIVGAGLVLAAAGLWISPGGGMTADLALIKLVLSLVAGFVGLALIQCWATPDAPEAEIDVMRSRVRLVRRGRGRAQVLHECSFAELGRVERRDDTVTLWDAGGRLLAEVAPADPGTLRFLVAGLRDAGKL